MKILHVITSLRTGGAEKLMVDLLPRLAVHHDVELLVFDGVRTPFYEELEKQGIKIYNFGENCNIYNPLFSFKLIPFLKRYDIVHSHNYSCQLFVALANILVGTRIITTEHNTTNRRRGNIFFYPLDKLMYRLYDKIICISDQTRENLKHYLHWEDNKFTTIYNGIDTDLFISATPADIPKKEGTYVITMVSAFRAQKDQDTLVRAMTLLPEEEYELWLVGGDNERLGKVQTLAKDLGVEDRVSFLGIRSDIPQILKAADAVVLSSHYEGFGLAAVEGMAAGKPTIVTDVDGLHEIVNGYGILFPHEDAEALANAIRRCKEDKEYAEAIGKRCQQRAKDFDISKMTESYSRVYNNQKTIE